MSGDLEQMAALVRALVESIRDPSAEARVAEDAGAYLKTLGLAPDHVQALADLPEHRLLLYRKLVRRGLKSAVRTQLADTAAALGPSFERYIERFCDEALPSSPYLRDVPGEFVAWALPLWLADAQVPAYLGDLARFELLYFEIANDAGPALPSTGVAPALDLPLAFQSGTRLARFNYPVHALEDGAEPKPQLTALLGYRDSAHEVHFLELSPLAASMAERLLQGLSLGDAVRGACESLAQTVDAAVLEESAEMLADWSDQGIVLGGSKR